jgi:hypothetical protein
MGMNWAWLLVLSAYLFGFATTGRLMARGVDLREGDMLMGVFCCALLWPLTAAWLGGEKALIWFFGG